MIWAATYLATALAFLACDAFWLTIAARHLYRPQLGTLLRDDFSLAPAVSFYVIYIVGILVFAVAPALDAERWSTALWRGALLGLVAYATYDLTNQATVRNWSSVVTIADLCWGTVLTGFAATIGFAAARWVSARF